MMIFCCDPWESYIEQIIRDQDHAEAAYDLEADLEHEHGLAAEWLADPDQEEWPWYAEKPYIVQRPQVFEP